MREIRLSGSMEGVVSNHDLYSDSADGLGRGTKEASEAAPKGESRFLGGAEKRSDSRQRISGEPRPGGSRKRKQRLAVPQWRGQAIGRQAQRCPARIGGVGRKPYPPVFRA